ncbi:hypothetical protein ACLOJK_036469 [Asimina triloba]
MAIYPAFESPSHDREARKMNHDDDADGWIILYDGRQMRRVTVANAASSMQAWHRVLITDVLLSVTIFNAHADVLLENGRRAMSEGGVDVVEEAGGQR